MSASPALLPATPAAPPSLLDRVEAFLTELASELEPAPPDPAGRGRPRVLPALALWGGLLVCVLRGWGSQKALWRRLAASGLWHFTPVPVSDEAVYKRLAAADPSPGETLDALVWLGAHRADRAKHAVRLVQFRRGRTLHRYLTNVRDPRRLPLGEIARLYARRWDIELAVKTAKTDLGLHLLWSAKAAVVLAQVWAVLLVAQVLQALRVLVVAAARVDPFDVSLPLLVRYLPLYARRGLDPIAAIAASALAARPAPALRSPQVRPPGAGAASPAN